MPPTPRAAWRTPSTSSPGCCASDEPGQLRERPLDAARRPPAPAPVHRSRTRRSPSPPSPRPPGPRLAGRYGHGLLSIGATLAAGFDVLALHWDVMEERAAALRRARRPGRVAPGRAHAHRRDARAGLPRRRARHRGLVRLLPAHGRLPADGRGRRAPTSRECIDFVNESGVGAIGTPDDAVAQIERLWKQSNGGFGAYLQLAHDWAGAGRQVPQLRAVRPARRPALPGPRRADDRRPEHGRAPPARRSPRATSRPSRWPPPSTSRSETPGSRARMGKTGRRP